MELEKTTMKNRTGIATAKKLSEEMLEGTREFGPSSPGDEAEIATVRAEFADEAGPMGSIPPPATVKQAASTVKKAALKEKPTQLVDELGARLAFERTGVRLYEALLTKFDTHGAFDGGPTRAELEEIRREELEHFHLLKSAIERLGGDPTALTPKANVQAVISMGVPKVLADPRTTLSECLEAILTAELVDNVSWEALIETASVAGEDELVEGFRKAFMQEQKHLAKARSWCKADLSR